MQLSAHTTPVLWKLLDTVLAHAAFVVASQPTVGLPAVVVELLKRCLSSVSRLLDSAFSVVSSTPSPDALFTAVEVRLTGGGITHGP